MGDTEEILKTVASFYSLSIDELTSGRRTLMRTWARHCAAFLLRSTGRYSWADVARVLKYGDHTGPLDAVKTVQRRAAADPVLHGQLRALLAAWRTRENELYSPEGRD